MKFSRSIHAIDSHTMGEPTRIVTGGIPHIPGSTMAEKKEFLEKNLDHIRTALMHEPRGHEAMFGSIITAACSPNAHFGIVFMHGGGYLNMCGHGSIGAVTVALETGMVPMQEPVTEVIMDAPAGLIKARALIKDSKVKEVSIVNVPSFLYKQDLTLELPDYGTVKFDISFGGSFFAIIDAKQFNVKLIPENSDTLKVLGVKLLDLINKNFKVQHPELAHINTVDLVEFFDTTDNPKADLRNTVVFGLGQIDRSPCGTGTSAKIATLVKKGKLKQNEEFVYESISSTLFKGKAIGTTKVGEYDAIIPEITGSAYITGFNHFVIDDDDPLKYGFVL